MKTAIAKDRMRAIRVPSYRSRTSAMTTTRGPAAPKPCSTRPAIIVSKSGARTLMRHPAANSARPAWIAGLRPMRSESGPKIIWPRPSPRNAAVYHELHVVRARRPEVAADRRQGRQHRVDGERDERHQQRDERHELAGAKGRAVGVRPSGILRVFTYRHGGRSPL